MGILAFRLKFRCRFGMRTLFFLLTLVRGEVQLEQKMRMVFPTAKGRESWPTPLRREKAAEAARSPPRREAQTLNLGMNDNMTILRCRLLVWDRRRSVGHAEQKCRCYMIWHNIFYYIILYYIISYNVIPYHTIL